MTKKKSSYKVKVNGQAFDVDAGQLESVDWLKLSPSEYHFLYNNRSLKAAILEADSHNRIKLALNGEQFDVEIRDELAQMLEQMGYNAASSQQAKEIKAPMPGLVLDISVKEGQDVNDGDKILILEAMKMENSLMVSAPARIKKIHVKPGDAVDKGQLLVELE
jgi:biotin carboxyl carrier protein